MQPSTLTRTAHEAIPMKYSFAPVASAVWKDLPGASLRSRDLHLAAASGNRMGARELRASADGTTAEWPRFATATFAFLFLLEGSATFEMSDGQSVTLGKHDVVHLPLLQAVRSARHDAGFAAVEIWGPLAAPDVPRHALLDIEPQATAGNWESAVAREREEAYRKGEGPRKFFLYRDLGSADLTDRRIHIHVVRAVESMPGGTGWHDHSMSQLFMVLRGEAVISVEEHGESRVLAGDAMTVGASMRHDVSSFSPDYLVLEMCLPGDYTTTTRTAPWPEA